MNFYSRQQIKSFLGSSFINRKGVCINEKLIIIESDDWGAIRTPSKDVLAYFDKKGDNLSKSIYKNDCLESGDDLEKLFDVLKAYKGGDGKSAVITANTIMANPDFEKIRAGGYNQYHWQPFVATYKLYPKHQNNWEILQQGIKEDLFQPQFHGREHLNVKRWMKALESKEEAVLTSFDQKTTYSGKGDYSFMEAYDWDTKEDLDEHKRIIAEGLNMFEEYFAFRSKSFIAPCYNWDSQLETFIADQGVNWIQGLRSQLQPTGVFNQYKSTRHYFGETKQSLLFNVRNCFFEPSMLPHKDWVDSCLAQIQSAFLFSKPAVICSHRINYMSYIDERNGQRGLDDLNKLLKAITKKWPDAIFTTTDELSNYLV